jgi:hypothetical protein
MLFVVGLEEIFLHGLIQDILREKLLSVKLFTSVSRLPVVRLEDLL